MRGGGEEANEASETTVSLPFCVSFQFSRDSIRAINDRIKVRENRKL